MGGSSGAVQSSTTTSNPWEGVQQPLKDTLANAQTLYSQPYQSYQGQTVAGPADSTVAGYNLGYQRATLGAPDLNAARGMAADMAGGAYLNSNPWLGNNYTNAVIGQNAQNMANAFATGQAAQNDAAFARQGAYGGSAWSQKQGSDAANLAQQVGQMANNYQLQRAGMGAQDYQSGVNNMLQAGSLAGNLSQDDWKAADYLRSMGSQQEGYQQKLLDSAQSQWNDAMNSPYKQMQSYFNMLTQAGGMGSTGVQTMYGGGQSPLGLGVGAGLLGLGAYNAVKAMP